VAGGTAFVSVKREKKVIVINPRGFCAGVARAVDIVKLALVRYGAPVYVRKQIVHNRHVISELEAEGAIFVDALSSVPPGGRIVFSAHGVAPEVRLEAQERQLNALDATCPLVSKVHHEAMHLGRQGYSILLVGHRGHEEIAGTFGEAPSSTQIIASCEDADTVQVPDPSRVAYLTQTTLSLDDTRRIVDRLRARFPAIRPPPSQDICYATQNRQLAVKAVAAMCDHILVIGSPNSSNSVRLVEVAQSGGVAATLIDGPEPLMSVDLSTARSIGVTAGASTPEIVVERVVDALRERGYRDIESFELLNERVRFALPAELRN